MRLKIQLLLFRRQARKESILRRLAAEEMADRVAYLKSRILNCAHQPVKGAGSAEGKQETTWTKHAKDSAPRLGIERHSSAVPRLAHKAALAAPAR